MILKLSKIIHYYYYFLHICRISAVRMRSMDANKRNGESTRWYVTIQIATKAQRQNHSQMTAASGTLPAASGTWGAPFPSLGTNPWATRKRTSIYNICRPTEDGHWCYYNRGAGNHDEGYRKIWRKTVDSRLRSSK